MLRKNVPASNISNVENNYNINSIDSCSIMFTDYGDDSENITAAVRAYEQTAKIRSEGIIIKTPVRRLNIISAANDPESMILRPKNHKNQIYPIEFIPYGIIHSLDRTAYRTAEKIAEKLYASWGGGNNSRELPQHMGSGTYSRRLDLRRGAQHREKTTPCLVPYNELPEYEKDYDRKTAFETIKTIIKLGYKISKH